MRRSATRKAERSTATITKGSGGARAGPLGRRGHELAPVIDEEGEVLAPVVPVGQEGEFSPVQGMEGMGHTETSGLIVRIGYIRPRRPTASRNASSGPSKRTGCGSITSRPSPS